MREWADFSTAEGEGGTTLTLQGPLLVSTIGLLDRKLRNYEGEVARVDLSQTGAMDTVGAWTVLRFAREFDAEITGADKQAQVLIDAVKQSESSAHIVAPREQILRRVPETVGELVIGWWQGTIRMIAFMGSIVAAMGRLIAHPRRFRHRALIRQMELVGVSALGIIGLMSFLIGIVVAQQGAAQLRQFGAEIYTINLTGRLTLRELGVLMTAIMIAGRSGSAFAAQLGTMKLTEEVDAMRTIGVSPIEALVVPRVLAAVFMMPLLGIYSSAVAIIGGAFVADLTLGIPFLTFLERIKEVVPIYDVWVGLIKAPVFGLIVALAGCYQGMQVEGDSEQVGLRTTMAVVQAIFMVIVLDAFFAVFFTEVGWGVNEADQIEEQVLDEALDDVVEHFDGEYPIVIHGLRNAFGDQVVHEDLDLKVRRGEILGVVGGSGTGKSVLMRSIIGLQVPEAGCIEVFGKDIIGAEPDEEIGVRSRWGVLFQGGALFSTLTVGENVEVPLKQFYPELNSELLHEIARYKVVLSGLPEDAASKYPSELSGGMKKRAGLARALALDPELLFLDEPTAGLDPIGAAKFDELTRRLTDTLGLTVFLITHDLDTLYAICDRVAVLADKKVIAVGTIPELLESDHPWIQEYFNGPRSRAAAESRDRAKAMDKRPAPEA